MKQPVILPLALNGGNQNEEDSLQISNTHHCLVWAWNGPKLGGLKLVMLRDE
jgi:hypothetical protein